MSTGSLWSDGTSVTACLPLALRSPAAVDYGLSHSASAEPRSLSAAAFRVKPEVHWQVQVQVTGHGHCRRLVTRIVIRRRSGNRASDSRWRPPSGRLGCAI